jgi:hypothetical protein
MQPQVPPKSFSKKNLKEKAMRLYIKALEHVREKGTINYEFAPDNDGARFWPTVGIAEGIRDQIVLAGGTIVTAKGISSDFRVEPRPLGGFVVSCELNLS